MIRFSPWLLAALVMTAPLPLAAADTAPSPKFRAFTSEISCEAAVKSLDQKEGLSDFALLVSAFITGANYVKNRDSQVDLKGMLMLTEQYCRQNPKQSVTTALIVLDKAIDQRLAQQAGRDAVPSPVKP